MTWLEAVSRWYGVLVLVTWAFAPVVRWLCSGLADRGAALARPIALLAAIYPAWLIASGSLVAYSAELVMGTVAVVGSASWLLLFRKIGIRRRWIRSLIAVELVSLAAFVAYLWLRGYTPQILGTEKPMDVAFLASSARTLAIPPPDPWFAGAPINYYYLGYLTHGTIARLSGVAPETAFNLALATTFSATLVAAFGLGWNIVRPFLGARLGATSGFFASFALTVAGNLYAPARLLQDAPATLAAWWWDSATGIGWRSSRIVCDGARSGNLCQFPATETINEFPFFSFLLGDLHPHLMALPFTLVAIGLAWSLALGTGSGKDTLARTSFVKLAVSGAIIGSLYALNAWDLPVYLLLACVGAWVGAATSSGANWKAPVLLAVSALLAWLPFWLTYIPPTRNGLPQLPAVVSGIPLLSSLVSALGFHLGERTSAAEYLTIFGVPYVVAIVLVATAVAQDHRARDRRDPIVLMTVAAMLILPGVLLSAPVIPLCGLPLALALGWLRRSAIVSPCGFALTLFAFAWAVSLAVEIVYLRDAFDDRMNTLFKFYYQTWTLYAIAAAVALAVLWAAATRPLAKAAIAGCAVAALIAGAAYPAVASYQWTGGFAAWKGLSGMAFAEAAAGDEVAAIRWLEANASPSDRVLEAAGCAYRPFDRLPFNRVSAFTGLPTVIGWGDNHQRQWRAGEPQLIADIGPRQEEVAEMFANPQSPLFDKYRIKWLFTGSYETENWQADCASAGQYAGVNAAGYPGPGWTEAFRSGETAIYRRDMAPA